MSFGQSDVGDTVLDAGRLNVLSGGTIRATVGGTIIVSAGGEELGTIADAA